MKHLRKLDKYNFILAEQLNEPKTVTIAGKEVTYLYKNLGLHYNDIYWGIRGFIRHNKLNIDKDTVPLKYKGIKPTSDDIDQYLETDDLIERIFNN